MQGMQKEEEEEKGEIGRKVALAVSQARELGTGERGSERGRAAKVSLDRPSDPPSLPFSPPLRIHFLDKGKRRGEESQPAAAVCGVHIYGSGVGVGGPEKKG